MKNKLYFLNWDRTTDFEEPESQLYHDLNLENIEAGLEFTAQEFSDMYREMTELETDSLKQIARQWSKGSGEECVEFLDLHYCQNCSTYLETPGTAEVHARTTHGHPPGDKDRWPNYIRSERSLDTGDVVYLDDPDEFWMATPIGWEDIEVFGGQEQLQVLDVADQLEDIHRLDKAHSDYYSEALKDFYDQLGRVTDAETSFQVMDLVSSKKYDEAVSFLENYSIDENPDQGDLI